MRSRIGIVTLSVLLSATSVQALNEVVVRSSGISNDERREALDERLRGASLSATALDELEDPELPVPTAQDLVGVAQSDYARIVSILYTEGYFGPSVSVLVDGKEAADIDPFNPPSSINKIEILVKTGDRFRFGKAEVAPRATTADPTVPLAPGFETGEIANSSLVGAAANTAVAEWRNEGHAKADIESQSIVADHPARKLDVEVAVDPGPRLKFGNLTITGTSEVSERRLRQILGYPEGEVYSPEELRDAVNRLRRSGVFSVVTMTEAETPNPDGTLDYTLTLVDEKKRRFGVTGEYATLDGLSLSTFWLHRNLFGGAERLRIDAAISNLGGQAKETFSEDGAGVDYSLGFRLTRPGTFGADNDLFVYSLYDHTDDPEYLEDEFTLGVGVSRYFSDELYGEIAGGLRYSDVEDVYGKREFYHFVLPGRLEWDKRDDPGDALTGFYLNGKLTPYVGLNGSQDGAVGELDARAYYTVGQNNNLTFAGRTQIGTVVGSDLDQTPPDFLFFSGGGDTVRGYEYQSLGVDLGDGETSGGRSFLGLSGEIRSRFSNSLGVVAFMDAGYIGPNSVVDDEGEWHSGVGLGVRYDTPIGPLRVDLATPYSGEEKQFSSVELYIGVGQAF